MFESIAFLPDFASTDLANQALSSLFGPQWWDLYGRGNVDGGPLMPMLSLINAILAMSVGMMTLYHVTLGAIGTANGTFNGENHNFWWPLRVVMGMGMAAPLPFIKGLSAFQIIIMFALGVSNTMANSLWTGYAEILAKSNFTVVSASPPPHMRLEGQEIAKVLYDGAVAQLLLQKAKLDIVEAQEAAGEAVTTDRWNITKGFSLDTHSSKLPKGHINSSNWALNDPHYIMKFAAPPGEAITPEDLGVIKIPGTLADPIAAQKWIAAHEMYNSIIAPIAYRHVFEGAELATDQGWLAKAVSVYDNRMLQAFKTLNASYKNSNISKEANQFVKDAKALGWFSAGAFQMKIASMRAKAMEHVYLPISTTAVDADKLISIASNDSGEASSIYATAHTRWEREPNPSAPSKTIMETYKDGSHTEWFQDFMNYFSARFFLQKILTKLEREDPVLVFASFGHEILDAGIAAWSAMLGLHVQAGAANKVADSVLGKVADVFTLSTMSGASGALKGGLAYISGWFQLLLTGIFVVAVVFAYVMPAMPLIYWSLAMVGFLMLVVEVMVAAPFWVAAHAWSPKGEGLTGEMGKRGYLQFLEIFFRPPLYILGFFVIITTMQTMGMVLARLFETFYVGYANTGVTNTALTPGPQMGIISNFFMAIILGGLYMYMFYYLCSEGYSQLPKKVIRWIGGEGQTLGASAHSEKMKGAMAVGVEKVAEGQLNKASLGDDKGGGGGGDGDGGGGDDGETPAARVGNPRPEGVTRKRVN